MLNSPCSTDWLGIGSWRIWRVGWVGKLAYLFCCVAISCGCWFYYAQYWGSYAKYNLSIEFCEHRYCDFTLFYYEQARVILHARSPIPMYFYSPTFALLLVPLAHLSMADALAVWTWVQGLSLVLMVVSGVVLLRKMAWWTHALFLLLTLTSYPILNNWKWGQTSTASVALVLATLAISEHAPAAVRSLPLALATSARYYPAMYLLAFADRKNGLVIVWFLAFVVALLLVLPAVMMGPTAAGEFYYASAIASHNAIVGWVTESYPGSQYIANVLARVGGDWQLNTPVARNIIITLGWLFALLNFAYAYISKKLSKENGHLWTFCFVGGTTSLILPTAWMHYFVYLPFAQVFLCSRIVYARLSPLVRALLLFCLWMPCVFLSSIFFFNELGWHRRFSSGGYLFFSNALMLALAYILALPLRKIRSANTPRVNS